MDSLDFGQTDLIKHHIDLTDYTPIKDRYHRIPLPQYEEVRKHLKEMLDIGTIRCSNSPWASPVVLVHKKYGSKTHGVVFRGASSGLVYHLFR